MRDDRLWNTEEYRNEKITEGHDMILETAGL